jgi:hypothetical protein
MVRVPCKGNGYISNVVMTWIFLFAVKLTSVISQGSNIYTLKETCAQILFFWCSNSLSYVSVALAWNSSEEMWLEKNSCWILSGNKENLLTFWICLDFFYHIRKLLFSICFSRHKQFTLLELNRNIIVWFKDVLTTLHVNCMILFDNNRLIHGLFHIALVISSRPWYRPRETISFEGYWKKRRICMFNKSIIWDVLFASWATTFY